MYEYILADLPVTGVRLVETFSPSLVSTIHDLSYKNQAAAPNLLAPLSNFPIPYVTRPSAVPYHPIAARANQHELLVFAAGSLVPTSLGPVLDFKLSTTPLRSSCERSGLLHPRVHIKFICAMVR